MTSALVLEVRVHNVGIRGWRGGESSGSEATEVFSVFLNRVKVHVVWG